MATSSSPVPAVAFLKIWQIIGNPKAVPPVPALIPLGRTSFLNGVKSGKYPAPVKINSRSVAWRVEDIRALIEKLGA
ncbi:AlpA family transcriptional regulator [Methylobacter tundripaludum]|uniref:AlpA family transcriptional regulator n=1 Tax=Methylobacter tundripaludum TaxID=173365 RepID=A0A2S6HHH9_9GAMM|nr:AlpA family phage regulatory protein [Methylobacter tundripaludum]PPK76928.1 AlpA family transcriptional regulator [Methylobacter tundripaludum]